MRRPSGAARGVRISIMVTVAAMAAFAASALAQESRAPTAEDIIRKLRPPQGTTDSLRTDAVAIEGRRQSVEPAPPPPSIDLEIKFEYASSRLTSGARKVLDTLAQALSDPALRDSRFLIAGHTDARGSDAYNLALSRQRARAVADYLVRQGGIRGPRLSVEGLGRSRLLDPAHPESPVNRRVQITNLGS